MKKHILIMWAAIALCSCSKTHSDPKPVVTQTWISGKWQRTLYGDTLFYANGTKTFTLGNIQTNELDFIDTNKVTQTETAEEQFIYSLSKMTIDFTNGRIFTITKISDNSMRLDWHYFTTGVDIKEVWWVDEYTKE